MSPVCRIFFGVSSFSLKYLEFAWYFLFKKILFFFSVFSKKILDLYDICTPREVEWSYFFHYTAFCEVLCGRGGG